MPRRVAMGLQGVGGGALRVGRVDDGQFLKRQGSEIVGAEPSGDGGPHTHDIADVTGLQDELDGKQAAGSYAASDHDHDSAYAAADHTHPGGSEAFPVGSVFIAVVSTNPATLLGYGTWSAFSAGRVLVGIDAGQTEFDTVKETGGAKTHTLTAAEMPSHTHVQDAHTHLQNAHTHVQDAHTHTLPVGATDDTSAPFDRADAGSNTAGANAATSVGSTTATNQSTTAVNQNATAVNQSTGGGGAHNNLQPYIVVYMWERTA
jgi:microcystin-dependent protein